MNKSTIARIRRTRIGSVLVLTAVSSLFLIGMAAMVTDVGTMYYNQARLQTAVNAGWKAGYDKMMLLKGAAGNPLTTAQQTLVKNHVIEVMKANGYTEEEAAKVNVTFPENNKLSVISNQKVGLFFARAMDFKEADIAAGRANHISDGGETLCPLAIPHGVTKDLSKDFFSVDFFDGTGGFASGSEYILKLGSGGGGGIIPPPDEEPKMILVPMGRGDQNTKGYLRAYGVAYWCLKIDDEDTGAITPVMWLLGYDGGSFMLQHDDAVISKLNSYGVNYNIITGAENIQDIYDEVNPHILELFNRPRIAVYTSQPDPDPVMEVLQDGRIPYGTYSLPSSKNSNGWKRNENYSSSRCSSIYDDAILNGVLDDYHWLHLHHEDFTGFSGGCDLFFESCKDAYDSGRLGSTRRSSNREDCKAKMCSYCRSYFDYRDGDWARGYEPHDDYKNGNAKCHNAIRRCVDKYRSDGVAWRNDNDVYICRKGNSGYPQCWDHNTLRQIADDHDYTSDSNSEPKPQYYVNPNGSQPLPDNPSGYFDRANKVQKMKWEVVRKVKEHVNVGGFLFAQCFAPETFDLSLWQSAIHDGATPQEAYANCVAFKDFHYKTFPRHEGATWYSDINTRDGTAKFNLKLPLDPRCQNHSNGYDCDTDSGHTASFVLSKIKSECTILGVQSDSSSKVKYIKGSVGKGDFTFLGGHYHRDVYSMRLVLNNILLGSLVTKETTSGGGGTVAGGRQKNNYGPIDPDNFSGGGADDYRDRFKYGYTGALQLGDRLTTEAGNLAEPTDSAVDFKVNGDIETPPGRLVIIPITDVGPEVSANNATNKDAQSIYDLQGADTPNGAYAPDDYNFGASTRIIGFAEFRILDPSEYTRDGVDMASGDSGDLGSYQTGQVRAVFVRYIVKPGDVAVN